MFKFNKEIFSLKLTIANACNLRCRYCFVNKKDDFMDLETAGRAIRFFLASLGKNKMLIVYGGEPLLHPLWPEIILIAEQLADKFQKKLIIGLPTNGILLNKENLLFLKRHKVALSISIDGNRYAHNQNKKFLNKRGTFNYLLRKIKLAFNTLGAENVSALMTIAPNLSKYLYKNFLFIIKLGFSKVHIDPVHGANWSLREKKELILNFYKIADFCFESIKSDRFIFLCPLFNPLTNQWIKKHQSFSCPFYADLEIYPQGEISFSQFLINSSNENIRNQAIIGNIRNNFLMDNYKKCKYSPSFKQCQSCLTNYYQSIQDPKVKGSELVKERNKILEKMNNQISLYSFKDERYTNYYQKSLNLWREIIIS